MTKENLQKLIRVHLFLSFKFLNKKFFDPKKSLGFQIRGKNQKKLRILYQREEQKKKNTMVFAREEMKLTVVFAITTIFFNQLRLFAKDEMKLWVFQQAGNFFLKMWHFYLKIIIHVSNFEYVAHPHHYRNFFVWPHQHFITLNFGVSRKITYSIVSDENKIFNRQVTKKENPIYLDDYLGN